MPYEIDLDDEQSLAEFHFRIQYAYNTEEIDALLKDEYKQITGEKPNGETNILLWFFENYVYEGDDVWVLRNGSIH